MTCIDLIPATIISFSNINKSSLNTLFIKQLKMFALDIARQIVTAKIRNSRTMIQKRKGAAWESNGELKERFEESLRIMGSPCRARTNM